MSGDQLNIEERLKLVQQKISAGKSALEETEVLPLCQSINELLVEIDHKIISDSKTAAESILHIFYDLHPSGLIYEIAQNVSVETAFNFGKLLLEQSGANVSNNLIGQISIEYLELIRQPEFLTRIYGEERWEDLTLQLIINSNLTLKKLFDQRRRIYDTKTLFNLIRGKT